MTLTGTDRRAVRVGGARRAVDLRDELCGASADRRAGCARDRPEAQARTPAGRSVRRCVGTDSGGDGAAAGAHGGPDRHFRQGNAAFEQKKWAEAEAAYRQAWQLARTFDVAANLGEVLLRLDKPRDAARFLAFSIKAAPPSAKAAHRDRTRHFLEEAKSKVGTIRLRLNVSGARVTLDGAAVDPGEVADELFVDPGRHSLVASHEGHQDARAIFNAAAGSSRDVTLTLAPMEAPRRSIVPGVVMGNGGKGVPASTGDNGGGGLRRARPGGDREKEEGPGRARPTSAHGS